MSRHTSELKRVSVILNPKAGQGRLLNHWEEVLTALKSGFDDVQVYETTAPGEGASIVKELHSKTDVILAAGGDGTVHEVAEALLSLETEQPAFGILPGGTCNDFSRALGMNQNPVKAAEQINEKKLRQIDVGEFDGQFFTNFWGVGLITHVSESIDPDTKEKYGRLSYYLSAAKSMQTWEPFEISIESEEFQFDGKAAMFLAVNGPFTGGIKPFFPNTDIQDGKLDCLLIEEPSISFIWDVLQNRLSNSSFEGQGYHHFQSSKIQIKTDPQQLIDCDGERGHKTPSVVTCLKQHLSALTGDVSF
ncbi:diacylglycerol/lipid kinase family protein [Fictibacillus phosphorivorans]|uniref:diacylglycerol/lipid kinase family protein n=1 Tax=Fictibacillus phosphorivorans TaxID=1221500 RepID=UPI00203B7BAF|nr:diacylglycerol kinase family protein [Fictibacillus phosphorivorans]MCM3717483.1 diacylglycerol kinase family lipid kinase [Fictibacillus phosphorivorans]MCM3775178.1 diacylglycerol kinase family lipid kinase [Fictibacillus phosphorivorans]